MKYAYIYIIFNNRLYLMFFTNKNTNEITNITDYKISFISTKYYFANINII